MVKKKKGVPGGPSRATKYRTLTNFLPTYLAEVGFSSLNYQRQKFAEGQITPSVHVTIMKLTNSPNELKRRFF